MEHRILGYYEATGFDITHFLGELQRRGYVYGTHYLPHDAKHKTLGYKHSIEEILRNKYPESVRVMAKRSRIDGINAARLFLARCWFDEDECEDGLKALRHYRYKVTDGKLSNEPLHDWASDGADAFRTLAMAIREPDEGKRENMLNKLARKASVVVERGAQNLGWMG
jgi:phage terminase large subunit